jgi:hypothetical protein
MDIRWLLADKGHINCSHEMMCEDAALIKQTADYTDYSDYYQPV